MLRRLAKQMQSIGYWSKVVVGVRLDFRMPRSSARDISMLIPFLTTVTKMLDRYNSKKEGLLLAHGFRGFNL